MNSRHQLFAPCILLALFICGIFTSSVVGQDNPELTEAITPTEAQAASSTVTIPPTVTPSETVTLFPTEMALPLSTVSATSAEIPEITVELTTTSTETPPETTLSVTETGTPTPETAMNNLETPPISPTPSEISTETPTLESSATPITVDTSTGTPTLMIPMAAFQGNATYQNRQPDNAGIRVRIYDGSNMLLDTAATDAAGLYHVDAPTQEFFWLVVDAPLHQAYRIGVWPGETLPLIELKGGDLDGDGCVGLADLALLTENFSLPNTPATDISNDGLTDAADFAILSGNFRLDCGAQTETPALTPEAATVTPEATATPTNVDMTATLDSPTPTPEPSITPADATAEPTTDITVTPGA